MINRMEKIKKTCEIMEPLLEAYVICMLFTVIVYASEYTRNVFLIRLFESTDIINLSVSIVLSVFIEITSISRDTRGYRTLRFLSFFVIIAGVALYLSYTFNSSRIHAAINEDRLFINVLYVAFSFAITFSCSLYLAVEELSGEANRINDSYQGK